VTLSGMTIIKNGIQDSDETGVEGVKITLNETEATTTTDSSGKYSFCELENGNYSITIDKSTLPDGYHVYISKLWR